METFKHTLQRPSFAAAVAHLPENTVLTAKEFFNGFGEAQAFSKLEELGYEILRPSETQDKGTLTREVIEAAMDAFDLRETAEFETVFSAFKEPTKYWVRSTKPREDRKYPTKPIVGFLSQKTSSTLNGGWSQPSDAAGKNCTKRDMSSLTRMTCRYRCRMNICT